MAEPEVYSVTSRVV